MPVCRWCTRLSCWIGWRAVRSRRRSNIMAARRVALLAAGLMVAAIAVHAQSTGDRQGSTDRLLDALKAAPDERAAALLESQLEQAWLQAGSPAVTLLISRGLRLLQAGQNDSAAESFTDAITL